MNKKYKIGIALSGGGARGFAHLGVLKALEEKGIIPDVISGVSVGSVVGALIADGRKPSELIKTFAKAGFLNYTQLHVPIDGLFSLEGLVNKIKKELSVEKIEDLRIPLIIGTTNLNTGMIEFFDKGSIGTIVKASCSIPILFAPVNIGENKYADGGVVENVPISVLSPICEKVIAVDIHPTSEVKKLKTMHQIALRVFDIHVAASSRNLFDKCDLLIAPKKVNEYDILDTKNAKKLYKLGYDFTRALEINL